MEQREIERGVEAILFALGEPVSQARLSEALEVSPEEIVRACQSLAAFYEERQAGIRLTALEDHWQLVSAPQWGPAIRSLLAGKKADKLSPAAMETLALVAYYQPVTRAAIDQMRGVDSSHSLSLLLDRELIAPCGNLDAPGRPLLYRTTTGFLRSFGLASLDELPPLPDRKDGEREEAMP